MGLLTMIGTQVDPYRPNIDRESLVIQYDDPSDLSIIRNYIRSSKGNCATSIINQWVEIDIYINLNAEVHEDDACRIIYECLLGNPKPSPFNDRFGDCNIIHINNEWINERRGSNVNNRRLPKT